MAIHNVYHNTLGNVGYIFKDGSSAFFKDGTYTTGIEQEIKELDAEVKARHPNIYVVPDALTIDTEAVDPIEQEVQKRVNTVVASLQRDLGESKAELKPATSATLVGAQLSNSK